MKTKNKLFVLIILILLSGCAAATDLHVMTDDLFGASDDIAPDEPSLIIYDEEAFYSNKVDSNKTSSIQSQSSSDNDRLNSK